jgi:hypothetical protein
MSDDPGADGFVYFIGFTLVLIALWLISVWWPFIIPVGVLVIWFSVEESLTARRERCEKLRREKSAMRSAEQQLDALYKEYRDRIIMR